MNTWFLRLAVVGGLTYAAVRFLPLNAAGKTIALAIGGVSAANIIAGAVPAVGSLLTGQVPALPNGTEV